MRTLQSVCVFCGASTGRPAVYAEAARALGRLLALRGIELVTGGGRVGLMGAVADAALESGGRVVGVIPGALMNRELGHPGLTELLVVGGMHERKQTMADRADAFIAMPGGFGTLDELMEATTWAQLGFHRKPIGLLNVAEYYTPLCTFLDRARDAGFLRARDRALIATGETPEVLLDRLVKGAGQTPTVRLAGSG